MAKSKTMSAKNAWGKSTGYAEKLMDQGMEATRAQQLENWQNQQEVRAARQQQRYMTEEFDQSTGDEDWRNLSNYAGQRVDTTDLDAQLGAVTPGQTIHHHFELTGRLNRAEVVEFGLTVRCGKGTGFVLAGEITCHAMWQPDAPCASHLSCLAQNSFMGFSDFRARFTPETGADWSVEPTEGSLSGKKETAFAVKYRPQNPGVSSGYLVIETDDDKWTFQVTGSASM